MRKNMIVLFLMALMTSGCGSSTATKSTITARTADPIATTEVGKAYTGPRGSGRYDVYLFIMDHLLMRNQDVKSLNEFSDSAALCNASSSDYASWLQADMTAGADRDIIYNHLAGRAVRTYVSCPDKKYDMLDWMLRNGPLLRGFVNPAGLFYEIEQAGTQYRFPYPAPVTETSPVPEVETTPASGVEVQAEKLAAKTCHFSLRDMTGPITLEGDAGYYVPYSTSTGAHSANVWPEPLKVLSCG